MICSSPIIQRSVFFNAGRSGNPHGFSTDNAPVIAASDNETLPTSDTAAELLSGHVDPAVYRWQATDPGRGDPKG